jgi:hypothetical protein
LWCLPHQDAIPPLISTSDRKAYDNKFTNDAQVQSSVQDSIDNNAGFIDGAKTRHDALILSLKPSSTISYNIGRIPEPFRLFMFRTVACFGLERWAPDVLSQDPQSVYNSIHEHIALLTFEQVAQGYGYSFMGVDINMAKNFALMRKFYRSFVFSYCLVNMKAEAKSPGAVMRQHERENIVRRVADVGSQSSEYVFLLTALLAC